MQTIDSPSIPFCYPINGGLAADAELIVHGCSFNGHGKNFVVDFRAGSDIALHFNPRFKHFSEHTIVLNTFCHGEWQREERHKNRLHIGDTFRLRIVNHHNHFLIELNEHHVCHYSHKIPVSSITHLEIKGDVSVHRVHMTNFEKYYSPVAQTTYPSLEPNFPQPNYQPPPPAYSPYASPQPQITFPQPYSSYPVGPVPMAPMVPQPYPGPTSYVPGGVSYIAPSVELSSYQKSCGCSVEHCHHGTFWDPHGHHHQDSHHHHHHHHHH